MCLWQKVFVVALLLVSRYGMADLIGVDFGPSGNTPMHWTSITGKGNFSNLTTDEGVRTTVGLYVSRDGEPYNVSPNPATLPRYKHDLGALDGNVRFRFPGSAAKARAFLPVVGLRVLGIAGFLFLLTWGFRPDLLFRLPRERLFLWWMILLLYPFLSVFPQMYIFRVFFLQRYRPLFGEGRGMLWVNALFFAWSHAFMLNWIAPLLSVVAGYLLADTWQRTRHWRLSWGEHALYGQIVFTVGLGLYFYNGSARALETLSP